MCYDTVAEWLRRSTRNRLGLSRAGSSPVSVVFYYGGGFDLTHLVGEVGVQPFGCLLSAPHSLFGPF